MGRRKKKTRKETKQRNGETEAHNLSTKETEHKWNTYEHAHTERNTEIRAREKMGTNTRDKKPNNKVGKKAKEIAMKFTGGTKNVKTKNKKNRKEGDENEKIKERRMKKKGTKYTGR